MTVKFQRGSGDKPCPCFAKRALTSGGELTPRTQARCPSWLHLWEGYPNNLVEVEEVEMQVGSSTQHAHSHEWD